MFLAKLARHTTIDSSKLVNNDHELAVERTLVWPEMLVDLACTRVLLYTAALFEPTCLTNQYVGPRLPRLHLMEHQKGTHLAELAQLLPLLVWNWHWPWPYAA